MTRATHHAIKSRATTVSVLASAVLAAAKFIVGIAIGSLALISEGLHSCVDLAATVVTWVVVRLSDRPADAEHHYGHGKIESLSALGLIALLYILAGGIVVEAVGRLRDGVAPPALSVWPFAVLLADIVVNFWRARALRRAAQATGSQALAADALHFTSDLLGTFAVLAGLGLVALGYDWGDAAAAIGVAAVIAVLGIRLGRSTVETLLDRAPDGATEIAERAIRSTAGVVAVERTRLRKVGPTTFVDATVQVPRTLPIDRIEAIKQDAEQALDQALGETDLTFTTVPVALDNESVRERIMVIARNGGLAIHHVTVHDLGDRLTVSIDLEVDGEMTLAAAHAISVELEEALRTDFGADLEVDIHIEPLEPELPLGTDAARERTDAVRRALVEIAAGHVGIGDVHDVRVRDTEAGEIVNFHCRATPTMRVSEVHDCVDEIERALRRAFPSIRRVISHAEPAR